MIRDVLRMGDPRLWQVSEPVKNFGTPELADLLQDMRDTMAYLSGAGLAAPQIGVQLRVVIFGVHANPRFVREVSGFHARVVQHECDRLHGVLYPIRIRVGAPSS